MSDVETLDSVIPEAKDLSSKDENLLTDMYQEPKHVLNKKCVISGLVEYIRAGNSLILPQFLTSVQHNQVDGPASPPTILQPITTVLTVDPTMDGQFTVDAPITQVGQKQKAWDLQSILVICT